jgi:hypothetical protein
MAVAPKDEIHRQSCMSRSILIGQPIINDAASAATTAAAGDVDPACSDFVSEPPKL